MKRFKEPVKSVLIVLLALSAAFLAWRGQIFAAFFPPAEELPLPVSERQPGDGVSPAALPVTAAVSSAGGLIYGVKYDRAASEALMESFTPLLAEALGSAEEPSAISEEEWRSRLFGESLYLDYGFSLPISVLSAWMGVEAPWAGELEGSALLLDRDGSSVRLSFRDGEGNCRSCGTAASWPTLRSLLEENLPNGAAFAFSIRGLEACEPYELVLETLPQLYLVQGSPVQEAAAAVLAEAFGIHLAGQSRFTEENGTVVYPGDDGVLRLSADGGIEYASAEGGRRLTADSPEAQIEAVRKLLEQVRASCAGDELLILTGAESGDELVLTFDYEVEGLRLILPSGSAARAVWRDGALAELSFTPRSYQVSGAAARQLPEKQAAAAAGSLAAGSAAELILYDGGEDRLSPVWIVTSEGRILWTADD